MNTSFYNCIIYQHNTGICIFCEVLESFFLLFTVGVGLGLSVVRGFVEAMEGTVNATDTAGGGLTMIVDLPSVGVLR